MKYFKSKWFNLPLISQVPEIKRSVKINNSLSRTLLYTCSVIFTFFNVIVCDNILIFNRRFAENDIKVCSL